MSSSISKLHGQEREEVKRLPPVLEAMRHKGWRGGLITPHRAFVRLRLGPRQIVESVVLAFAGAAAWIAVLPTVGRFWGHILAFWGNQLGLKSDVILVPQGWGSHIHFALPCFGLSAGPASGEAWWITTGVTILSFGASFLLAEEALPWAYLLRGLCLLQATALGYFAIASARFPHDLPGYTVSMLVFSCVLIGLIPVLYGFTFYLLDFTLAQKIFLTLVTMAHLAIFVPQQYMLHVYLLHGSVLFMPVLYFVLGPFLDILVFIGFYSWGMSWRGRNLLVV
ncbi:MAG TPA: hypothetical protein VK828_12045 [Terriglobales bacterium]|nr:hypothetical protein [Terriglobales bacterium]